MQPTIDPRIVKVGLEIGKDLKTYEGLQVLASGTKYANPIQNECEIRIYNLSRADREYILTETSPFNKSKVRKRVFLWVGRESYGTQLLFAGDIITSSGAQPPDIVTTLRAKTGQTLKGQLLALSTPRVMPLSSVAQMVAKALDLSLDFQATETNVSNYAFSGSAAKQVDQLGRLARIDAFIDDTALVVKDSDKPLRGTSNILSAETGLVGVPELTDQGVRVRYLLDRASRIGSQLEIHSEQQPAANGKFTIFKLGFEVALRDTPFYYVAEAKRNGRRTTTQ